MLRQLRFKVTRQVRKTAGIYCKRFSETFGHVDIFIHNAGPYMHDRKPMTEYGSDEWKYIMDGNLIGFFLFCEGTYSTNAQQKLGQSHYLRV
ncbi:SDR family oxidoreductase [Peribacillus frigoritolerans]|nr:SDR family oxidoreductase [Peribacillus frigoritolerans]